MLPVPVAMSGPMSEYVWEQFVPATCVLVFPKTMLFENVVGLATSWQVMPVVIGSVRAARIAARVVEEGRDHRASRAR